MDDSDPRGRPSLWQVLTSVLAAGFGVQSQRNRERDFSKGSPLRFVLVGLAATALFVLVMTLVVRAVLSVSGG